MSNTENPTTVNAEVEQDSEGEGEGSSGLKVRTSLKAGDASWSALGLTGVRGGIRTDAGIAMTNYALPSLINFR